MNGKLIWALAAVVGLSVSSAAGEMVCRRWSAGSMRCPHPNTITVKQVGDRQVMTIDLSALPAGAKVVRATLRNRYVSQPREPIRLYVVTGRDGQGKPTHSGKHLRLAKPWFRTFDLTEAVRAAAGASKRVSVLLAHAGSFNPKAAYLDVVYDAPAGKVPDPVTDLSAVHHDGQTFLTWKELPRFRPAADKALWVDKYERKKATLAKGPGKGFMGRPRLPAIYVRDLRALQMLDIINPPSGTQTDVKYRRRSGWPDIRYRVWRSGKPITARTIGEAELCGEVGPLNAYDTSMVIISSRGEYYDKREVGTSVIPTYCVADGQYIPLGSAYYVHTPQSGGKAYYAVTVMADGVEDLSKISSANSLSKPVAESKAPLRPVLQYIDEFTYRGRQYNAWKYYTWQAPPVSNLPVQRPAIVEIDVPKKFTEPGGLLIGSIGAMPGDDWIALQVRTRGGGLGYNAGIGTFLSMAEAKVDYFSETYLLYMVRWALDQFKIDRNRVLMIASTHFAMRHPELVKLLRAGPIGSEFEINFDEKFNPVSLSLAGRFGPADAAMTVDGHKAWDTVNLRWFLKQDPARDVPFFYAYHGGKESGHAIEYGWQDDPMGWAALRDARQPYTAGWGGGHPSRQLDRLLYSWPWDKPVPAFSNCSLDGHPGNGDPSDGDPSGTINGYLLWEPASSVDKAGAWEMTVRLAGDAPAGECTVDLTPRHCKAFKPKAAQAFVWSNTADGKKIDGGKVLADKWGLVTLKQIKVSKAGNRIVIGGEEK